MSSFDETWETIHANQEWGKYPTEPVIRFIARNYYNTERSKIKILDFGCGGGAHTWYLVREGFDTYAFDGSKSAVEKTKKRVEEYGNGGRAHLQVCDGASLNYSSDFFDCIIDSATSCSNTIDNIKIMYLEMYRVLKCGGRIFTSVFSRDTCGYGTGTKLEEHTYKDVTVGRLASRGIVHWYDREEIYRLLKDTGFCNIHIDEIRYTDLGDLVVQYIVTAEKLA